MDEPPLSPKLNDVRYFICRGENQYGPYTLENIRQYVTQGSILYSDYLWAQGMPNRITVQTFLQASTLAAEPPPALPAPNLPAGVPHQAPMPSAMLSVSPAVPATGNALTWPFHQKEWISSLWIPFLWWFLPVFPIGTFASLGWMLDAIERRAHGAPSLFPQSRDIGRMLLGGLVLVAMYAVYFIIPLLVIGAIFSWTWADAQWRLLVWIYQLLVSAVQHTPHEDFAAFALGEERSYLFSEFAPIVFLLLATPLFVVGMVRYALTRKAGIFFRIFSNLAILFRHLGGVLWFMIISLLSYVALAVAIGLLTLTGVGLVLALLLVSAEFWVLAYLARNLAFTMSKNKRLAMSAPRARH